jgi:ATPase subunit of ABC transporter with duplicated ATPase domains
MTFSLSAEGVSAVLPDGTVLFHSVDLSLPRGLTALVGPNGVGKSTLLDILAGRRAPSGGLVVRRGTVAAPSAGERPAGRDRGPNRGCGRVPRLARRRRALAESDSQGST